MGVEKIEKPKTVQNERTEWLQTLCDGWRQQIADPFGITVGDVRMVGATNGKGMTLLRAQTDEIAPPFHGAEVIVSKLAGAEWAPIAMADFDSWLLRAQRRCPGCGGLGFVALYGYAAFGPEGEGPEHDLWEKCSCQRPGLFMGQPVDRKLVMEYLGPLTGTSIEATRAEKMIALRSPDWLVIIMGLDGSLGATDAFPGASRG